LQLGVVPIFNENDTVSTAEIESRKEGTHVNFGDNDKLSALIASKIEADLLLILTDVQGLFTDNPLTVDQAKIISTVETISPEIEALVFDGKREKAKLGRGGMATKLEAAKIATQSGCTTIVASGKIPGIIASLLRGEEAGTIFLPMEGMKGKQRWIAFATSVRASLVVNQGAKDALILRKASLLAAGLVKISGLYERGDVVSIIDEKGHEFARGIVNYSSSESEKLIGLSSASIDKVVEPEHRNYDALVTRDNLVILDKK
jgi:glutamate 5-kinase